MRRYFFKISFKGTGFHGWQTQPNATSVQETIETCLAQLFSNTSFSIVGCGRTDTGVHAKNYFFHVDFLDSIDEEALKNTLNKVLPKSIVILDVFQVDSALHARFNAKSRTYRYFIHQEKEPFLSEFSWFMRKPIDLNRMNEAAQYLIGKHDFASFAKSHSDVTNTFCEVSFAEWKFEGSQLVFEIRANRFLRNMVRAIVGTLLEVGYKKLSPDSIPEIMLLKSRQAAALSVPAEGLFLWEITY